MTRAAKVTVFLCLGSFLVAGLDLLTACHVQAAPEADTEAGAHLPAPAKDIALAAAPGEAIAVFAGGCFWCTEAVFEEVDGVKEVVSGYTGGDPQRADYKAVSTGATGHAESIRITYDPSKVTYGRLLRIFFGTHDPTTKDRQGPDAGTQYRSAIFTTSDEQKAVSEAYIQQLADAKAFSRPITTTMQPLDKFFPAEEYHQDFVKNNPDYPYVQRWAKPKLKKLEKLLEEERVNEE